MRLNRIVRAWLVMFISICCFAGCGKEDKRADFSGINAVCELATLKCYYHNVARVETEVTGLWKYGYKKIWIEYSGIVQMGIDVHKVSISKPDEDGVIKITIPDAEILSIDLDEDSMGEPLIDHGFLTKVTKEEETDALAQAQENMEETARENTAMLAQAKERAKKLLEGYVKNIGEQIGKQYTVEWIDLVEE